MWQRRDFLRTAGAATASLLLPRHSHGAQIGAQIAAGIDDALRYTSESMEAQLSRVAPRFVSLNIDGLGKGRRGPNILDISPEQGGYSASRFSSGGVQRVEYRTTAASGSPPVWRFEFSGSRMILTSEWSTVAAPQPLIFPFDLTHVHSTVLGLFRPGLSHEDKLLALPVLMHFPGQGSMRVTADVPGLGLKYDSDPAALTLPAATAENPRIRYTLNVTALHPAVPGIAGDLRFDAFRRNWLNALQLNPSFPALANNTNSDTCAFCYYEFADIAAFTPPLADGLTALDLVRQTLDRVLAGGTAYGLPPRPWSERLSPDSDTFPSLLIAAANVVREGRSDAWLEANYAGIRDWAETMLATDSDGNGLIKYSISGNSGIWESGTPKFRPSNWWDTIGFGHEDAYGNALAYRALVEMAGMAAKAGKPSDAERYRAAAAKLRSAYYRRFYDPATGVLAGWRSADSQLHDYYFLWVNGIAIHYGLVPRPEANAIMDRLLAKMKGAGYGNFHMGLPGNLVTVPLKDCVDDTSQGRFGCGSRADNSDGFQNYENGGATGAFAYFTLAALYDLGRRAEADRILFAMLDEYSRCGFEQRDANGMSTDWRRWDGTPKGYEGFLTDNYYTLLAVPLRQSETRWESGFRPSAALP